MSTIKIKKIGITDVPADAVVNAANDGLWAGGGVCGAIFKAAGNDRLREACNKIGGCKTGSAVITEGFDLKAKYIIHAVGPVYRDGRHGESKLLYSAYMSSLRLAEEYKCRSVAFPLISAGIFGYPKEDAWKKAIQACRDFLRSHDVSMDIIFAVLDDEMLALGNKVLKQEAPQMAENESTAPYPLSGSFLMSGGRKVPAVFFHKPQEPFGFLSNWYPSRFTADGITYTSAEQYIMYHKCMLFGDGVSAQKILAESDVQLQQDIGRKAAGYDEKIWNGMRQLIALRALYAKFSQNPALKEKLLETGDAFLVECAFSDRIWACGAGLTHSDRLDTAKWTGQNILGFALMEVRRQLRESL